MTTIGNFKPFWQKFLDAFPDLHITVDDVIAEGDKTCVRITGTATHTGPGLGVPPTHKPVKISALILIEWRDGKIQQAWNEFDAYGMMQQLGAPTPGIEAQSAPPKTMQIKT